MADDNNIQELVDKDLKGVITPAEKKILINDVTSWRNVLLGMKKRTEMQFTSCRARKFDVHSDYVNKKINNQQYLERLNAEMKWRVNAARFLQQVERKLMEVSDVQCD